MFKGNFYNSKSLHFQFILKKCEYFVYSVITNNHILLF